MNKLGLFGGTFNPIHNGHLRAAEEITRQARLEKILFIPSYIPPHKEQRCVAPAGHRLAMLRLALAGQKQFIPSAIEIEDRQTSYSIYTLRKIKKLYPEEEPFFIIGIDAFLEIRTWKDYERVLEESNFFVLSRPGFALQEVHKVLPGKWQAKTTWLNEGHFPSPRYSIFLVEINALPISASAIRERVRQGKSITGLVPKEIENYIYQHHLYQDA